MFQFINDIGNYESRKLGKTEVNGLIVSTAYTSDGGYETAIIDANKVHPVERYDSKEKAQTGHEKWCKEAESIETINKLGWLGIVKDEIITLNRVKK